jgi:hypothetical protein
MVDAIDSRLDSETLIYGVISGILVFQDESADSGVLGASAYGLHWIGGQGRFDLKWSDVVALSHGEQLRLFRDPQLYVRLQKRDADPFRIDIGKREKSANKFLAALAEAESNHRPKL